MHLPDLQQSAFFQSLGWAIANSLWQGAMLWVIYKIIVACCNTASAKLKNGLSTLLLFTSFLWFIITFVLKLFDLRAYLPTGTSNRLLAYTPNVFIAKGTGLHNLVSAFVASLPYFSAAYLLLLLLFSLKLINSYKNTNFIKNRGLKRPAAQWRVFVETVANHIGINTKVKIWFSSHVDVPATIGFLKPVILIPLASINQLTAAQMEAIILHEISHIKRNDYLINLLVSLIETILFFNPFVVLLSKIIKKERENCCDDFVLQYQYDPHSYASALLVLEQSREQQIHLALAATSGHQQLFIRIKRIMEVKNSSDKLPYGQKLLALLISTAILCSMAWLTPEKKINAVQGKLVHRNLSAGKQTLTEINIKSNIAGGTYSEAPKPVKAGKTSVAIEHSLHFEIKKAALSGTEVRQVKVPDKNVGQAEDKIAAIKSTGNQLRLQKDALLNNFRRQVASVSLAQNFTFPDLSLLDNLHFNIDFNTIKADMEKAHEALSLFNSAQIQEEICESLQKLAPEEYTRQLQNNDWDMSRLRKEDGKDTKEKLQRMINGNLPAKSRLNKISQSLELLKVLPGKDFHLDNQSWENKVSSPKPLKKKPLVNDPPHPAETALSYTYDYQSSSHQEPAKRYARPLIINYNGGSVIIINGEKINFAEVNQTSTQVKKLVRRFITENIKNIPGKSNN